MQVNLFIRLQNNKHTQTNIFKKSNLSLKINKILITKILIQKIKTQFVCSDLNHDLGQ